MLVDIKDIECFFSQGKEIISFLTTIGLFIIGYILQRKSRAIQDLMLFKEFREPLIKFTNEAIDAMSAAEGLCECNPEILGQEFFNRYNKILTDLSSLRDKGKLIIPNTFPEKYGPEKASAYKGIRDHSLQCLTAAYYLTFSINFSKEGYNKHSDSLKTDEIMEKELNTVPDKQSEEFKKLKQLQKIKKGLDKLPGVYPFDGPQIGNYPSNGWSSKKGLVEAKRQFVSITQDMVKTRYWGTKLITLSTKDDKTI